MMRVAVFARAALAERTRADRLTGAERRSLARAGFGPQRRAEWIAGRVAARRALVDWLGQDARPVSVVSVPSGAPRMLGRSDLVLSLSHDGPWVAVATTGGGGQVAVDLCDRHHGPRLPRLLERLGVSAVGTPLSPCAAWATLECALKLRGLGIASLLDARPVLTRVGPGLARVSGLGADATVNLAETADYALAWARERSA